MTLVEIIAFLVTVLLIIIGESILFPILINFNVQGPNSTLINFIFNDVCVFLVILGDIGGMIVSIKLFN